MTKKILTKFAVQLLSLTLAFLPLASLGNSIVHADAPLPTLGEENLIDTATGSNSSFTIADTTQANTPSGWEFDNYDATAADDGGTDLGTSTVSSVYPVAGQTDNDAARVTITDYKDGNVDWAPSAAIPVVSNQAYRFTDYYEADVSTEVDVAYTYPAGSTGAPVPTTTNGCSVDSDNTETCYDQLVASVAPATNWTQVKADFTVPTGVTDVSVYHLLAANGTLTTDDYSLTTYTPAPFDHPMVSVTFDDGWESQVAAAQYMNSLGMPGTFYIISDPSDTGYAAGNGYMGPTDVTNLSTASNEIGSHTVHHCDLASSTAASGEATPDSAACPTPIPASNVLSEMQDAKTNLEALTGKPVTDFAYPYGSYDASTINLGESLGYASQRTVTPGYNTADSLNPNALYMYEVDNDVSVQQVETWINNAIAQGVWLVLCYHEVTPNAIPFGDASGDDSDQPYTTALADFQTEMTYLQQHEGTGAGQTEVETVANALTEAESRIGTSPAPFGVHAAATTTGQETATVTWTTNQASTGQVDYGTTSAYGQTVQETQSTNTHSLTLTGLTVGTTYHVRVTATDTTGAVVSSDDLMFTTLPAGITGDVNNNGRVDDDDATLMYANWGRTGTDLVGDVNSDGVVNDDDATLMYANWSK